MSQDQATGFGFAAFFGLLAIGGFVRDGFGFGTAVCAGFAVYFFLRGFQKGN